MFEINPVRQLYFTEKEGASAPNSHTGKDCKFSHLVTPNKNVV